MILSRFFRCFCCLFFRGLLFWKASGCDFEWILGQFSTVFFAFVVRNCVVRRGLPNVSSPNYLQYLRHVRVFKKKHKINKICEFGGAFLRGAIGDDFGTILNRFWDHFRRLRGAKIGKNAFQKRRQKKERKKVTQGCAGRNKTRGSERGGALYKDLRGV